MTSPWCRWLAAVGAALALLAAPPCPATASGPVPLSLGAPDGTTQGGLVNRDAADGALFAASSRRLRADRVTGTYTLLGGQFGEAGLCPRTMTLGSPVKISGAEPMELLRIPGESIVRDGTACAGGGLTVIRTLALMNERYIRGHQLRDAILRFNGSESQRARLEWSDSVGIGMDSWACGSNIPRWDNATAILFGDDRWLLFGVWSDGVERNLILEDGRQHMLIINTNNGVMECVLRGRKPTPTESSTRSAGSNGSGDAGGLSTGPVVGIAIGAAVTAVAAAGAVALGYRRWVAKRGSGGGGDGGGGAGGGGGGGSADKDGNGGASSVGGASPGTPEAGPPARSPLPSAAGGPPSLKQAPPPPYPSIPPPMSKQAAAAAAGGRPILMDTPGPPPQLPSGLFYTWETVTPSGSEAPTRSS